MQGYKYNININFKIYFSKKQAAATNLLEVVQYCWNPRSSDCAEDSFFHCPKWSAGW